MQQNEQANKVNRQVQTNSNKNNDSELENCEQKHLLQT